MAAGLTLVEGAALLSAGAGVYGAMNSGGGGSGGGQGTAQQQANPLAPYQQGWAQQLNQLMQDPSQVTKTPGYQFGLQSGQQQLQQGMAQTGQTQSGAEQIGMQNFGQQYAGQQYQQQISNLGNMATGNAIQGQQAGQQAGQQGWGNIMQGAGALSNLYRNQSTPSYASPNYGDTQSGYAVTDSSGAGYMGSSGM